MEKMYEDFKNVKNEYRPVPFWSWNDKLEEPEIRRQIREMKKNGYGGYFMHARVGLLTPYLGNEWMQMINAAIDEGNSLGMDSWLYDEDKWPSGFAGGIVPNANPDFRYKYLVCLTSQLKDEILKTNLQSQLSQIKDDSFLLNQFTKDNLISEVTYKNTVYFFYEWLAPLGDKWYNNTSYVDLLNPDCVNKFIESTYEKYYNECGKYFKKGVPGIFTDEPTIEYWKTYPFKHLPWTKDFKNIFKKIKGYDLIEHLLKLFIDFNDFKKVRFDYYDVITNRFVETYSKKIYSWCSDKNLIFTGHYLCEDTLQGQIMTAGAVMPNYEYETYPGIDMLGNKIGQIGNILTIKQMTSVADQLEKPRTLSETYGGGGWNFTFEQQKLMAEIQLALGVNLLNPHLCLYSMRGERKRDFPPSLFYQQPWWDNYSILNDYLSRLCYILSQGKRIVDVLIIHPITSAWMEFSPMDKSKVEKRSDDLLNLTEKLLANQIDFHFGDESIIEKYGKVEGDIFKIGAVNYKYVILPSLLAIRKKTKDLLSEFSKQGGNIISIGDLPEVVNNEEGFRSNFKFKKVKNGEFLNNIKSYLKSCVSISGNNSSNILIHHRLLQNYEIFYFLNNGDVSATDIEIKIERKNGIFELWDPSNGDRRNIYSDYNENINTIHYDFEPGESALLLYHEESGEYVKEKPKISELKSVVALDGEWTIVESSLNCFTIDYCQYKIDNIGYSKILPVNEVQKKLKDFGGKQITLKFDFEIECLPTLITEIYLIVEYTEGYQIKINNHLLTFKDEDWWLDISFKKCSIKEFIQGGMNFIEIECCIKNNTELENIYILGDFNLRNYNNRLFSILYRDNHLVTGDFAKQGYPFFAGKIKVTKNFNLPKTKFEKCILKIPKIESVLACIFINKNAAGTIAWNPMQIDITKYIKEGTNQLTIELISSCRNLLGPHHLNIEDPKFISPESFSDEEKWDNKYSFIPFGISEEPEVLLF